ncbi:MAG: hypothetical protein Q7J78_02420 [Clostridiales bacterium]|nr:hypothetical protein [Clostridiales bacterium]
MFKGIMCNCPLVAELKERGREIYKGELTYCGHCPRIYEPIAGKFGFKIFFDIEYDETGGCTGRCRWISFKDDAKYAML